MIDMAKDKNIKVLFVQEQFNTQSAEAIARELDAQIVKLDPLSHDWLDNMHVIANAFKKALSE